MERIDHECIDPRIAERRLRVFYASSFILGHYLRGELVIERIGIPSDALIGRVHYDGVRDMLAISVYSMEFDPVYEGDMPPIGSEVLSITTISAEEMERIKSLIDREEGKPGDQSVKFREFF